MSNEKLVLGKLRTIIFQLDNLKEWFEEHILTGTAGKYSCKKCGRTSEIVKLNQPCPFCDPDFPLHVRVAKALGWIITTDKVDGKWIGHHKSITSGVWWYPIKDYPNDLVAAMGALEEYCRKIKKMWGIKLVHTVSNKESNMEPVPKGYRVIINHDDDYSTEYPTLPQAICEAIVAHSEGK